MKYLENYSFFENNKDLEFSFLSDGEFCPICGEVIEKCKNKRLILTETYKCSTCNFEWKDNYAQHFDYASYNNEIIQEGNKIPDEQTNHYTERKFVSDGKYLCPLCEHDEFDLSEIYTGELDNLGTYEKVLVCKQCENKWIQYFEVDFINTTTIKKGIEIKKGEKYITSQFNKDILLLNKDYFLNKDLDKFNI